MILAWSRVTGRWRDGLALHSADIGLWETRFWSLDDNAHHLASFSDKVFLSLKDIVFCPWTTRVFDHAFENADERLTATSRYDARANGAAAFDFYCRGSIVSRRDRRKLKDCELKAFNQLSHEHEIKGIDGVAGKVVVLVSKESRISHH